MEKQGARRVATDEPLREKKKIFFLGGKEGVLFSKQKYRPLSYDEEIRNWHPSKLQHD